MTKFQPVEFKVLIKPDKVEQYSGSIIIPETTQTRRQIEQDKGTIIALGGRAFEDFGNPLPQAGDKVLMCRHAGYRFTDKEEDVEYRVVNDKDITMILGDSDE